MRRSKLHCSESHDRWLVSYADFITLLFAFFVVMFASDRMDKGHTRALSESIRKAFNTGDRHAKPAESVRPQEVAKPVQKVLPPPPPPSDEMAVKAKEARDKAEASLRELSSSLQRLQSSLKPEVDNGSIHLSLEQRGLIISLEATAFFPSGTETIKEAAYTSIGKVAAVLQHLPNSLRLEGHTDSRPISNGHFQDNWELSAARSIAMLRLLSEKFGIAPQRMAIVGYADTESVDSNETEQGRGRNRRVDIVIVSKYGMQSEPSPKTSADSSKKS